MADNDLISVIVPIYNIEKYLKKCIDSIRNQTYQNLEIILVDDGSTDTCGIICDGYLKKDNRIKIIHKKNGGLVSARKAGLAIAKGTYITFVDGDDWIENEFYEKLVDSIENKDVDMVLGGYIEDVYGNITLKKNYFRPGEYNKKDLEEKIYPQMLCAEEFFLMGIQPFVWNKLIKRDIAYRTIMMINESINVGEDVAAIIPILLSANRIIISNSCGYHYCQRMSSMTWHLKSPQKELYEIRELNNYLLNNTVCEFGLRNQINHYLVQNIITRVYGFKDLDNGNELWTYHYSFSDHNIAIYGAGSFGRSLYEYLVNRVGLKVQAWVDNAYEKYQKLGFPVEQIDTIKNYDELDILIAILCKRTAQCAYKNLIKMGIEQHRIFMLDISEEQMNSLVNIVENMRVD